MKRLIVNADDFGLTSGLNRAIAELHSAGVLTSATLMASARAADEAITIARATPTLGVGCHVVLVDGDPVLPPRDLPTLADPATKRFPPSLIAFLRWLFRDRHSAADSPASRELQAEAAAQIALLQSRGLRLTHIDTHKHTHIFPAVLRPVLRAARAAGITRVRNPFEPSWSRSATTGAPLARRVEVALLRYLEPRFRRIVAEEGFTTTDGAIGVLATGTLDRASIASLLRATPPGTWELVTHPAYNDADLAQARTRLLASRETERAALTSIDLKGEIELINFSSIGEVDCG